MTLWLLDTNVLSELRRPRPSPDVIYFVDMQPLETLHISIVTIAEIRYGIKLQADLTKRENIQTWLDQTVRPMFQRRVMPVSEDVMLTWRCLTGKGRRQNHAFAQPDLILAATALHHGMTIVSRDRRGFETTGVPFLNPWTP